MHSYCGVLYMYQYVLRALKLECGVHMLCTCRQQLEAIGQAPAATMSAAIPSPVVVPAAAVPPMTPAVPATGLPLTTVPGAAVAAAATVTPVTVPAPVAPAPAVSAGAAMPTPAAGGGLQEKFVTEEEVNDTAGSSRWEVCVSTNGVGLTMYLACM